MAKYLLIIVLLLAGALNARDVNVQGVAASDADVARLTAQIEPAFSIVEKETGLSDDEGLTLIVAGGSKGFAELAARDGVGMNAEGVLGYAMPGARKIVLNMSGIRERQMEPIGVLRHEIAHLVMGASLRVAHPLWFEEGVAQYVESMALNELRESAGATPFVDFEGLDDLNAALREEARAGAAYIEAREVIRLIVETYGDRAFRKLMQALAGGEGPFAKAFETATGQALSEFDALWLKDYKARANDRTASFFGRNFWWILLGLTALLLPAFLVLLKLRGRSQVKQWEETEKYFPSDPAWSYHDDELDSFTPEDPDAWKR